MTVKLSLRDRVKAAFYSRDEKAFDEAVDEVPGGEAEAKPTADEPDDSGDMDAMKLDLAGHAAKLEEHGNRLNDLEKDDVEEGTEPVADKAPVSKAVFDAVLAAANVVSPGIHIPTFDTAAMTNDTLCALRRRALATGDQSIIEPMLAGRIINSMPCDVVAMAFDAASAAMRGANNRAYSGLLPKAATVASKGPMTPKEQNEANRIHYANKGNR